MSLISYTAENVTCANPFLGGPSLSEVCAAGQMSFFLSILNSYSAVIQQIGDPCGRVQPIKSPQASYDFVVVGGAAGSIVAARLSEVRNWTVLLLEAGPDEPAGAEIPSNLQLYLNTELDWQYKTSGDSHACLNTGGKCSWPRGKNLGGCTAHHGMAYHRGHAKDYQRWVDMGNKGWSWEEVLPVFMKSEDNREIGRVGSKYHGVGGPMTVERFRWQPEFAWDVLKGADEVGLGVTEDMVGDKITGFTIAQTLSKDGVRQSTAAAYLRPIKNRSNLHIATNAYTTKILCSHLKAGPKVNAVRFVMDGRTYTVKVKKEVIVSGGAVNSPQLLLLSGIGPKEHLKSVGVRPIHDMPGVGENLHNHQSFGIDFTLNQPFKAELNIMSADMYLYNQSGPMASTGLAQMTAILCSSLTTPDDPDIQIFSAGYQATCNTNGRIADLMTYNNMESIRFTSVNLHPRSRGTVKLRSKNPNDHPIIWSNDLAHPNETRIIIDGIRHIFKLTNSSSMQKYGIRIANPPLEACAQHQFDSDEYWECAIHWDTRPENHQAGSCKMGPSSDPMAVVSPRLKVHGMTGLRVADASIMPIVVSGNPVATINMIGERAADFIKEEWKNRA